MSNPIAISPTAWDLIGVKSPPTRATVNAREFQRWAVAVGDENPLYFDEPFARSLGFRGLVMPPMFLPIVMRTIQILRERRPDGTLIGEGYDLPITVPYRRMAGGRTTTFHETVCDGDVLTGERQLSDLVEKSGGTGALLIASWTVAYANQFGRQVASDVESVIFRAM
jgi:acyl dehydratase